MAKHLHLIAILLIFTLTTSCTTTLPDYKPTLPDNLGDKGLVVGQIVGIGRLFDWSMHKEIMIDNRKKGVVVNSFIVIPLSPGEYELSSLFSKSYGGSNSYGGVTVTTTNTTTMPLKRKFTVQPKQITNLGLLVLYPDPQDKEQKKFMRLYVDNTADMKHFIKTAYPQHASGLNVDTMTLAPGEMMPDNLLQLLRKELATKKAIESGGYATYVAADVGTLAELLKGKDGKITDVKLIEVPTVSNLQSKSPNYVIDQLAFLTKSHRLFLVKGGRVIEKTPPASLRAGNIYVLSANDLIIVDDKFEIYSSYDSGDSWQQYLGGVTEKKVRPVVWPGTTGYYTFIVNPPRALFSTYGKLDFKPIDLPKDMDSLELLRERPTGLFAERTISVFKETKNRPFFFQASGQSTWETKLMPAANCEHIKFLDKGGLNVSTNCWDRAVWAAAMGQRQQYISKDGGTSWQQK